MSVEYPENEFLSILALNPKVGVPLLQLKATYLSNNDNRKIFDSMLKSLRKYNTIDLMYVADDSNVNQDKLTSIVSENYLPISNVRLRYLTCQKLILDDYKKRVANLLNSKLSNGNLKISDYLLKMEKLNKFDIQFESDELTYEEIINGLKESRINLTRFSKLNNILKLNEDDLFVIGARTGTGKSALMLNLMDDLISQKKYKCIYLNLEMSKADMYSRMIAIRSGIEIKKIENGFKRANPEEMKKINEGISEILEFKDDLTIISKPQTLEGLEDVIKYYKSDSKHTIVFIDHMGLIETKARNISLYEETTKVSKRLRQLCLKYDCTIISASQLRRGSTSDEEVDISELKNSGEIENSACKILLISKDKSSDKNSLTPNMVLDIAKNRSGFLGKILCNYDKTRQIFYEL